MILGGREYVDCPDCPHCEPRNTLRNGARWGKCGITGNIVYLEPWKEKRISGKGYIHHNTCSCGLFEIQGNKMKLSKGEHMKTELTMEESLKRERGMVLQQDFSERTLLAVAHSHNCIEALEKQVPMKPQEVLLSNGKGYECSNCGNELSVSEFDGIYCHWCGQKLNWKN